MSRSDNSTLHYSLYLEDDPSVIAFGDLKPYRGKCVLVQGNEETLPSETRSLLLPGDTLDPERLSVAYICQTHTSNSPDINRRVEQWYTELNKLPPRPPGSREYLDTLGGWLLKSKLRMRDPPLSDVNIELRGSTKKLLRRGKSGKVDDDLTREMLEGVNQSIQSIFNQIQSEGTNQSLGAQNHGQPSSSYAFYPSQQSGDGGWTMGDLNGRMEGMHFGSGPY